MTDTTARLLIGPGTLIESSRPNLDSNFESFTVGLKIKQIDQKKD